MLDAVFKQEVAPELELVNKLIEQNLHSPIALIEEIGSYLLANHQGKRLRPQLLLLSAKACNYQGPDHICMAAVIEFIHTATLLHDDVIDSSLSRRDLATVNQLWGTGSAILVGDFLYSRSFQMMLSANNMQILQIIADTTNTIAEGEILQLKCEYTPDNARALYLQIIRAKTAKLFAASAEVGAILAGASTSVSHAFAEFGMHLGTAYQIIDDLLDYKADVAEGTVGMPQICLLADGTISVAELANKQATIAAIEQSSALQQTREFAAREAVLARNALNNLPNNIATTACLELLDFVLARSY